MVAVERDGAAEDAVGVDGGTLARPVTHSGFHKGSPTSREDVCHRREEGRLFGTTSDVPGGTTEMFSDADPSSIQKAW